MRTIRILSIILFLIGAYACHKIESLPVEPYIEYRSFEIFDTTDILGNRSKGGKLTFYFEDGDGDIGINEPLSDEIDTNNLILSLYRKTNGIMVPVTGNDILMPSSYRIPFMEKQGQNKILKGTITVTFFYLFYSNTDTIQYDFYIKDRALHESNVASTNEIIISQNGTY